MHGGGGGGLPPVCCWMGTCASIGGGTIGKWLQASDFKCQQALQLGELGRVVEPSARSMQEPTAKTHQVTPQGPTSAMKRSAKSKSTFGKASPTDLMASCRHKEGWRWLRLSPWEQKPAEASTPQSDGATVQEVEG